MTTLFLASLIALLAAAAGLAIGALRGRPLRPPCAVRAASEDSSAVCVGCLPDEASRRDVTARGV